MDRALTALLGQTVRIEPFLGRDSYGKPTYGSAVARKAHISGRVRRMRDSKGLEVLSTQAVYLATECVGPDDRVTLPGGRTAPIVAMSTYYDESGPYAQVVYLGA